MNDRAVALLEQYEIEVLRTRKGRGAILCDTRQGCLIFKQYDGNAEKIELQDKLLKAVKDKAAIAAEQIVPTTEGTLFVQDTDGTKYILKTWQEGRECSIYDKEECLEAVWLLAKLHESMELPAAVCGTLSVFSSEKEFEKHNRELKKVRRYLQQRSQKQTFEIALLHAFDYFLEQALSVTEEWKAYCSSNPRQPKEQQEFIPFCHGDYQYHNIIKCDNGWFLNNFEKCIADSHVRDLYLFMRKLLEKSNWSIPFGIDLLNAYEREHPIGVFDRLDLYYRLAYPEKFWKIVNFYFNSGKAWIPGKNQEKLEKLILQEKEKQHFLDEVFRNTEALRG